MRALLRNPVIRVRLTSIAMLAIISACSVPPTNQTVYDLVILNGRVMDPASSLDAVRAVGITGGTIRAVSAQPLQGRDTLDARGVVRGPEGRLHLHDMIAARLRTSPANLAREPSAPANT